MSRPAWARLLLLASATFSVISIVFLPILFGPFALLAAVGAIRSGARRAGAALLFLAAAALALGAYLGCLAACPR